MAISSAISPEKIVVKNNKTPREARNFISGRVPTGGLSSNFSDSNVSEVEQPKVKPVRPDIGGILNSITTNITNNVENYINNLISSTSKSIDFKIKSLRDELYGQLQKLNLSGQVSQITNELEKSVKNISEDYQKKVKGLDEAKPSNFLNKFLGLYKNALEFVQFFSNKKNIDRISNNIDSLEKTFIDSFEVAKLVRKVIINIVKQLSNLPKVSPSGGGGINLDIDVPGSGLRKTAPRGLANMFSGRGKMLALGAGALGVGAAGVGAVNALQESDLLQPVKDQFGFNLIESLGSIIGRFTEVIDAFVLGSKIQQRGGGGGGSRSGRPGSTSPGGSPPSSPPGGNLNAADIVADTPEEKALIATVRESEGTSGAGGYNTVYGGAVVPELTQMTLKELYDAAKIGGTDRLPQRLGGGIIPYKKDEHDSTASGAVQLMPQTLKSLIDSGLFNWNQTFSPEVQNQMILALARRRGVDPNKPLTMAEINILRQEWAGMGRYYAGQGGSESSALRRYQENLREAKGQASVRPAPGQGGPDLPDFMLPPEKREELARKARNVSQPPPSQQAPQVNIMPLDMTGGARQNTSQTSSVIPSPSPQKHGPSVPFISSSNDDNFFVLYSKMVYNIVDG